MPRYLRVLALLALCTTAVEAQRMLSLSFELNVGVGAGDASVPHGPTRGIAGDVLMGYHPGSGASGGFVTALSVSGQTPLGSMECDIAPGGTCPIDFPTFGIVAAQVGWETSGGGARVLAGPALGFSRSNQFGAAQIRLDLARGLTDHFALTGSLRVAYVPDFGDRSFTLGAVGVGFRVR